MELDDFKQSWNEQSQQDLNTSKNNFMELIHQKSYGPLAVLKNKFRLQLLAFPVFVAIMAWKFINKPELMNDLTMWCFVLLTFLMAGYFWFNYQVINRLQKAGTPVKEQIEKDIAILENGFKVYFLVNRIILIIFAVLLELVMYLHKQPDFEVWYTYPFLIRFGTYVLLFILHYFLGKASFQRQYGDHISMLKKLLQNAS